MRFAFVLLALLAGCTVVPLPLSDFRGWSAEEVSSDRFRISVGDVKKDRREEAMHYAASLALQKGYLAFAILDEDGTGESGTTFSWNLGYTPSRRHGLLVFQPGKFFTVIFRTKRPSDSDGWFDAVEELGNRKPK